MNEITFEELQTWPKDSYQLIDIRDEGLVLYGMIPGALHINMAELENEGNQNLWRYQVRKSWFSIAR